MTRMRMRNIVLWLGVVLVLGFVNYHIVRKERLLNASQTVFFQLGPRDPRSLIQGDYMALRYRVPANIDISELPDTGVLVFVIDERQIAALTRVHSRENPLKSGEYPVNYQKRDGNLYLGTDAFFFQEGHAQYYATARYGEMRVSGSGESVLVGLRDEELRVLGPPVKESAPSQ